MHWVSDRKPFIDTTLSETMVFETSPYNTDRQNHLIERIHEELVNHQGESTDTVEIYGIEQRDRIIIELM